MLYLFAGRDPLAKDLKLKSLQNELLPKETSVFNFETFYAKELKLTQLQQNLLILPVKAKKRLLVIKQAEHLSAQIKDFLSRAIQNIPAHLVLALDMDKLDSKDEFTQKVSRLAKVFRFKEDFKANTFTLSRLITARKAASALVVLSELLDQGEKPERILGGLRYAWEKDQKKLEKLLNCDVEIKTGKLKADFALEKLVIGLCSFT